MEILTSIVLCKLHLCHWVRPRNQEKCIIYVKLECLGYNHPSLQKVMTDPKNISALINRPALGWYPNETWVNLLHDTFMSVAPKGHDQVRTIVCYIRAHYDTILVDLSDDVWHLL